jgi:hypothetical protein
MIDVRDRFTALSIVDGGKILRIRRSLVAVLVLALTLTGIFLATLSGTAGSAPARHTTVVVPPADTAAEPDGMGYGGTPGG